MFTILLVCTGNTCRSPMAAGVLERLIPKTLAKSLEIRSAGVRAQNGGQASRNAIDVCHRRGIDISDHRSRRLTRELVEAADLVLVMERIQLDEVRRLCPSRAEHALLLTELDQNSSAGTKEIADPCGSPEQAYEKCFAQIQTSLENGMKFLLELIRSKESAR